MDNGGSPERGEGAAPRQGRLRFTDELAQEIVSRAAAGHSLSAIARDPEMPCRSAIAQWREQHPAFDAALTRAQRRARLHRRALDRLRDGGALARPKPYDLRQSDYTPELAARICERLANGESLIAICRGDPEMPTPATVYRWLRRMPDFNDLYVEAREFQGDYLFDEAREVALSAHAGNVPARRLHFDVIRWQAARLAPNKYCERLVVHDAVNAEDTQPMTVVIRKFTEDPDATPEAREALERGKVVWSTVPGVEPGDLLPEGGGAPIPRPYGPAGRFEG